MKKGDVLLTIVFSIIGAIFILIVGANIFATTLNIVDDEALAVTSMRQIATAVNSAEFGDACASAELNMARNYQLNVTDNLMELWGQEYDEEGKAIDEAKLIDSINLSMDGRMFCEDESPQCKNDLEGLTINPQFDREIDQKFCVCNIYDVSAVFIGSRTIAPLLILNKNNFVVSPRGVLSVTCDNPVSQYRA